LDNLNNLEKTLPDEKSPDHSPRKIAYDPRPKTAL
jgi:hypothetical protein